MALRERIRLDIQGLRAVAVLMVVVFHAGLPAPGGFVGVDVFFVISGFVITGMLYREWRSKGRISFKNFYVRRFKRLFPALALLVTVVALISLAVLSPLGIQQTAALTGIGAIFISANAVIARKTGNYFDAKADTNPLLHTWSLSVEEQFYLLFPAFIALGWWCATRSRRSRHAPLLLTTVVAIASFSLAAFGIEIIRTSPLGGILLGRYITPTEQIMGYYSPLTRSWEFAVGVLVALLSRRFVNRGSAATLLMSILGATALIGSLWLISSRTPFPGVWTLLPVAGTATLLAAGIGPANVVTRFLSSAPMVKIGDWSYSVYLWHWPFVVFAGRIWGENRAASLLAAAISFIPAVISYRFVETPIRKLPSLQGRVAWKIGSAAILSPVLACTFILMASAHGYWSSGVRAMQRVFQAHAMTGCPIDGRPAGMQYPCVFNNDARGVPIYVVGDSTAAHFSEAAIGAGRLLSRPVKMLSDTYCEFKDIFLDSDAIASAHAVQICRERYRSTLDWLLKQSPGTVVVAEVNKSYQGIGGAVGLREDALTTDPEKRVEVLDEGLESTIRKLQAVGHTVLLVQAVPDFVGFDPYLCRWTQLWANDCLARMSRERADAIQSVQRSAMRRVAVQMGSGLWDPRDLFCDAECSTQLRQVNLYKDAIHISPDASRMLAPSLAEAVRRAPVPRSH